MAESTIELDFSILKYPLTSSNYVSYTTSNYLSAKIPNFYSSSVSSSSSSSSSIVALPDSCARNKQIIKILNTTIPLIWLIVGTITNGLSLIVFSRRTLRRNSTFFYLAVMTLSDFIVIWVSSFRDFLVYKFQVYISGSLSCKVHVFVFFLSCQFSSWLLTAANLDRLVFVISYNYSKIWCTKRTAIRVATALFLILICINFHFLLFVQSDVKTDLNSNNNNPFFKNNSSNEISSNNLLSINPIVYPLCTLMRNGYDKFFTKYYSWIDAFVYSYIPFLIMAICNTALIKKVFSTKRNLYRNVRRKSTFNRSESEFNATSTLRRISNAASNINDVLAGNKTSSKTFANSSNRSNHRQSSSVNVADLNSAINSKSASNNADSIERMRNMALTIIGVTLLFIMFTLPINIYVPIMASSHHGEKECDDIVFCILNNMVNANHSISFFIYLTTNSKFKKEIKLMFKKLRTILNRNLSFYFWCLGCGENGSNNTNQSQANNEQNLNILNKNGHSHRNISISYFATTNDQARNNSISVARDELSKSKNFLSPNSKIKRDNSISIHQTAENNLLVVNKDDNNNNNDNNKTVINNDESSLLLNTKNQSYSNCSNDINNNKPALVDSYTEIDTNLRVIGDILPNTKIIQPISSSSNKKEKRKKLDKNDSSNKKDTKLTNSNNNSNNMVLSASNSSSSSSKNYFQIILSNFRRNRSNDTSF